MNLTLAIYDGAAVLPTIEWREGLKMITHFGPITFFTPFILADGWEWRVEQHGEHANLICSKPEPEQMI